jgi:hypothetical protein
MMKVGTPLKIQVRKNVESAEVVRLPLKRDE